MVHLIRSMAFVFALAMPLSAASAEAPEPFVFVQLCDTQLGMGGYADDKESLRLAVEQINELKPDLVFICGDLVNDPSDDNAFADFKALVAGFAAPCHCAPGNHDVGTQTTIPLLQRYRTIMGEDYFEVQHKGCTFLVVNTSLWRNQVPGESEKHDAWFEQRLKNASKAGRRIFIVGHYPPFVKTPEEKDEYFNLPQAKRAEVLGLAKQYGVEAILTGHTHREIINTHEGILSVTSCTTSKNFDGAPRGFRVFRVGTQGALQHEYTAIKNAPPNPQGTP